MFSLSSYFLVVLGTKTSSRIFLVFESVCVCPPVESNPVSFQSGCELRSSFLQRLHEVLLDERSQLRRTLPGTDGLLQRHQTGHIPLLHERETSSLLHHFSSTQQQRWPNTWSSWFRSMCLSMRVWILQRGTKIITNKASNLNQTSYLRHIKNGMFLQDHLEKQRDEIKRKGCLLPEE